MILKIHLLILLLALSLTPGPVDAKVDAKVVAKTVTTPDNPVSRGKAVFVDRERGHCLLCHQVKQINESFQGNLGPDLSTIGASLGPDELYTRIADPTDQNPDTVMPAYFRTHGLTQVAQPYQNQPVLSAQEMEDLVAFLLTLTVFDTQE